MILLESHKVPKLETPIRLQEYGIGVFTIKPTKSGFKKAIKKQLVFVDKKIATTALFIKGGEIIELYQQEDNTKPFNFKLNVVFEDDYIAIINKPAGINVSGNSFATIDNVLTQNLQPNSQKDAVRPRPVHRLDYPTSGLLLIGKTNSSIIALNKIFEEKRIQKTYHAICIGNIQESGIIEHEIDNKSAYTKYNLLKTVSSERFGSLNLVALQPKTGRKHQLRKHLSALGNPILGDKDYFINGLILKGKGLYLQATKLEFTHPITKEKMIIEIELSKKFQKIFSL